MSRVFGANAGVNGANIFVNAGNKVIFDGVGGDTYFVYNASSGKLEAWVDGTKKFEF